MNHLTVRCRKMGRFTNGQQKTARWMLVWLLLIVTACQSNATTLTPETVAETQPPMATQAPPTATPALPTATPVPPTATPAPPTATTAPTVSPTTVALEAVAIAYMDPDTENMPGTLAQHLKIYRPTDIAAPYPTIFIADYSPTDYKSMVDELLARGYAVVLAGVRGERLPEPYSFSWKKDASCALAWTVASGASYDLDLKRLIVFGRGDGGWGALELSLQNAAAWTEDLKGCPNLIPALDAVKAVVTYDAWGIPTGVPKIVAGDFRHYFNLPIKETPGMLETLINTPPQEWYKPGVLDENTDKLARLLPLYWIHYPDENGYAPPFLLIYTNGKETLDYPAEAQGIAENMQTASLEVTTHLMSDVTFRDLFNPETLVLAEVVEMTDAFIRESVK